MRSNNEWTASSDQGTFTTVNPATGAPIVDVSHATKTDVDRAVSAARKAFKTTWGLNIPGPDRQALLLKFADLMERDQDKLAAVESLDGGKGVRIAKMADVADSVACLRYYAGLADKFYGQTIPHFGGEKFVYTLHQPIGVCGQIIPWNVSKRIRGVVDDSIPC